MLGLELAEAAAQALRLAERLRSVVAARFGGEQRWNGVPTVRLHLAGRAVIAGDNDHFGFECRDARDGRVEFLRPLNL